MCCRLIVVVVASVILGQVPVANADTFWDWDNPDDGVMGWTAINGTTDLTWNDGGYITMIPYFDPYPEWWEYSYTATIYHLGHGFVEDELTLLTADIWTENGVSVANLDVEMDWALPSGIRRGYFSYSGTGIGGGWTRYELGDPEQWSGNTGPTQLYLVMHFDEDPGSVGVDNWGAIPEPGTLSLLALAGLLIARQRR